MRNEYLLLLNDYSLFYTFNYGQSFYRMSISKTAALNPLGAIFQVQPSCVREAKSRLEGLDHTTNVSASPFMVKIPFSRTKRLMTLKLHI